MALARKIFMRTVYWPITQVENENLQFLSTFWPVRKKTTHALKFGGKQVLFNFSLQYTPYRQGPKG